MNSLPPQINILHQNDGENQWKRLLLRNSLYHFLLNNIEFLNSFSLCNNLQGPQTQLPSILQTEFFNQNSIGFTPQANFQDETLISIIQNINDSLVQLFNYYQEVLQINPAALGHIFPINMLNLTQTGNQAPENLSNLFRANPTILTKKIRSKEEINKIPTMRFGEEKHEKLNSKSRKIKKEELEKSEPSCNYTCNICLEDYKKREVLRILKCSHRFHKRCVDSWLAKKNRCPLCKKDV